MAKLTEQKRIALELTLEQAYYLRQLLWNVGGSPKGPRGRMDEICEELTPFKGHFEDLELPSLDIKGSVIMNNFE